MLITPAFFASEQDMLEGSTVSGWVAVVLFRILNWQARFPMLHFLKTLLANLADVARARFKLAFLQITPLVFHFFRDIFPMFLFFKLY